MTESTIVHVAASPRMFTQFRMAMIDRQRARHRRVVLYCPERVESESLRHLGFELHDGPVTNRLGVHTASEIVALRRFLSRERPEVVIAHQPLGAVVGITAARLARVPVKVYSTGGLKYRQETVRGVARALLRAGELRLVRWSEATLLVNREDEAALAALPWCGPRAVYVGPSGGCGIDVAVFSPATRDLARVSSRAGLGLGVGDFALGFAGRCVWDKGFAELIAALARLRGDGRDRLRLVVVGEGSSLASIRARADAAGVGQAVLFAGYRHDIASAMAGFDAFVLPSYREGLPVGLLQAMAIGLPVIASDVRGSREVVRDGRNGRLVPPRDAAALASAIAQLMDAPALARTLGEAARRDVLAHYSEDVLAPRMIDAIDAVIRAKLGA